MERSELLEALDAEITAEALDANPFFLAALGEHLRAWVARHAVASRVLRAKQIDPDPNRGGPPSGTPGASRAFEMAEAA